MAYSIWCQASSLPLSWVCAEALRPELCWVGPWDNFLAHNVKTEFVRIQPLRHGCWVYVCVLKNMCGPLLLLTFHSILSPPCCCLDHWFCSTIFIEMLGNCDYKEQFRKKKKGVVLFTLVWKMLTFLEKSETYFLRLWKKTLFRFKRDMHFTTPFPRANKKVTWKVLSLCVQAPQL